MGEMTGQQVADVIRLAIEVVFALAVLYIVYRHGGPMRPV